MLALRASPALFGIFVLGAPLAVGGLSSGCSSSHAPAGAGGSTSGGGTGGTVVCPCGESSVNGVPCEVVSPCAEGGTLDQCLCACTTRQAAGGCANACSNMLGNGGAGPANFCEGVAASSACATCLAETCPSTPTTPGTCAGM